VTAAAVLAPDRSPSGWARLAGVFLLLDACLIGILGFAVMTVFRPIGSAGHYEGQTVFPDQTPYWLLVPVTLLALAYAWAGQRAIRGIRSNGGRLVGIVLAGALGLLFAYEPMTSFSSLRPEGLALAAAFLIPQVLIVVALLRWPETAPLRA